MQTNPQDIPNEIVRSYSGRFLVKKIELERLVNDIKVNFSKDIGHKRSELKFLVGLQNGVVYETEDFNVVLQEENSQSLKIVLLVISGQVFATPDVVERRILVYFGRGHMNRAWDYVDMSNGFRFNVATGGMGYLIKERNRQSALDFIENIEERLKKFRSFYSNFPEIKFDLSSILVMIFYVALMGTVVYFLIWFGWQFLGMFPEIWDPWFVFPKFTQPLIASLVFTYSVIVLGALLVYFLGKVVLWFVPSSMIEIGDEVEDYKKQNNLRQAAFWTIIVGGIVGIVVNLVT